MQVKRLDLGADVVVLPERDLIVLHPDLNYAEGLGAIMGTLPDLHPDVAASLVDQVTPRPEPEPMPEPRSRWRRVVAVLAAAVMMVWWPATTEPASAGAEFGPDWKAAAEILGLNCGGSDSKRTCLHSDGHRIKVHGYAHATGDLYAVSGEDCEAIVFVFDEISDAEEYAAEHPGAVRVRRAVIW